MEMDDMETDINMEGSDEGSSGDMGCGSDEVDYPGPRKPKPEYMHFYKYSAQADDDYWMHCGLIPEVGTKRRRQGFTDSDMSECGPSRKVNSLEGDVADLLLDNTGYYKDEADLETMDNLAACVAKENALNGYGTDVDPSSVPTYYTTGQWRRECQGPIPMKKAHRRLDNTSSENAGGSSSFSAFTGHGFALKQLPLQSPGPGFFGGGFAGGNSTNNC